MVKYGKYLEAQARPEWRKYYLDYRGLKELIKESVAEAEAGVGPNYSPRTTSLTVARAEKKAELAEERFFSKLEEEVSKVSAFTADMVTKVQKSLYSLREKVRADTEKRHTDAYLEEAKVVGDEFLSLEKYVNLNYMGFHKILKKHDKMLPHAPCRQFYIAHLHQQPWVQGNYSNMLVQLSNIYSELRGDTTGQKNEDAAQGFVRSTTKYWVRTADVSRVKHTVLQHLPVFQFNKDDFSGDAQLINSVYMDNSSLELYHGRLDKKPGAIAARLRWYGPNEPDIVFVERKTHRESWKGEESVKERFVLPEDKVVPFLEGEYTLDKAVEDLRARGKSEQEIEKFSILFQEVTQAIDSKQLRPMVRTQYMRTAFQIPFDATVRVSLDTNLVMIKENPEDGPSCTLAGRWYRDPTLPIGRTEITRFPHAVLEVKLSLPDGESAPQWVTELIESGMLTEVHKFSKFVHGTCTLLPDMVQAVPYWVDDESVRPSMLLSAPVPAAATAGVDRAVGSQSKPRKRGVTDDLNGLNHPLLGDRPTLQLIRPAEETRAAGERKGFWDWWFLDRPTIKRKPAALSSTPMKLEPKTFFANERTFLSWLHMAVTIGSIACALLGFAGSAHRSGKQHAGAENLVEVIALILLPVAILMVAYALIVFVWRASQIEKKHSGYIDDRRGPLALAVVVIVSQVAILLVSCVDFWEEMHAGDDPLPPAPAPAMMWNASAM